MKFGFAFLLSLFTFVATHAQKSCHTQVYDKLVKSLQVKMAGDPLSIPCIQMGSDQQIEISFDALTPNAIRYAYAIQHCNADWTPSALSPIEYLDGFQGLPIEDYANSMATTIEYTNYKLFLPNEEIRFKVSGNYVVRIYAEDEPEKTVLTACFSVVEPCVAIQGSIRSNTDIDTNRGHQQVDFSVLHKNFPISHPQSDLKIHVYQNRRPDNAVANLSPSLIAKDQIDYTHNLNLVFEAGNEYRRMEFLSHKYNGMHVDRISFHNPYYHADLLADRPTHSQSYQYDQDQDGRFFVNCSGCSDPDTEADYYVVHFTYQSALLPSGKLYLMGDLFCNRLDGQSEMTYNPETGDYEKAVVLKQGNYNYQYLFVPDGETKAHATWTEGDYYQTENEYTIFVYYHPMEARYDRLVGVSSLKNTIQLF